MLNTKEKTNEQYWDSVQEVLDACCMGWMIRFGTCFNYLHIMGSGHLCDMAKAVPNLSQFSQQAVERTQALHSKFYYSMTQRGGRVSNKKIYVCPNKKIIESQILKLEINKMDLQRNKDIEELEMTIEDEDEIIQGVNEDDLMDFFEFINGEQ